jgi:ferric-dicitrate binding protein FerR (iron transport regulator)
MAQNEPLPLLPHEAPLPPRKDLGVAAAFLVFSAAIVVLSWRMPRFAEQGGEIYTAPGLVPSFYGLVLAALSLWLAARSIRRLRSPDEANGTAEPSGNSNRAPAVAAALGVLFVVGLIGRMPFWAAAAIFVTLFIAIFEWRTDLSAGVRARRIATALFQGVLTGFLVTLVFEKLFLVRLP